MKTKFSLRWPKKKENSDTKKTNTRIKGNAKEVSLGKAMVHALTHKVFSLEFLYLFPIN